MTGHGHGLTAEDLDLIAAARAHQLEWQHGGIYLHNRVELDALAVHRIGVLINDLWLYVPDLTAGPHTKWVLPTAKAESLITCPEEG